MNKIDNFKIDDSVIVKHGVKDPDLDYDLSGWQGRVFEIDKGENVIGIIWDSITLKNMPDKIISECEKEGMDWTKMYLEPAEVERTKQRDSKKDVSHTIKIIENKHKWDFLGEAGKYIAKVLAGIDYDDEMAVFDAWEKHLRQVLSFPFKGVIFEHQEKGHINTGDKVEVQCICGNDDKYGVLVELQHEGSTVLFPLSDLEATDKTSKNYDTLRKYSEWFANR